MTVSRAIVAAMAAMAVNALIYAPVARAISEDSPAWSCVDDGNRVCGPNNAQHAPAGCYDDGGVLVAAWPCHVVVNRDGTSDVFAP